MATISLIASIVAADYLVNKPTHAQASGGITVVSSASFSDLALAPGSLATAFGSDLATTTAAATDSDLNTPGAQLPKILGGTTVRVEGVAAQLLYVSRTQVNFIIPESVPPYTGNGETHRQIEVTSSAGVTSRGATYVARVTPAVFTMDGSGQGNPAAYLVRVRNGEARNESLMAPDATGRLVFKPIDLGSAEQADAEQVFLIMYLSGIRKAPDPNQDGNLNETINVKLNGFEVTPSYAGALPEFPGLEQMNVEIPRGLRRHQRLNIEITGGNIESNRIFVPLAVPSLTESRWIASGLEGQDVHAFASLEETLVAGAARGIFRLSPDGTFWAESRYLFPTSEQSRRALAMLRISNPPLLIAGTDGSGIWFTGAAAEVWNKNEFTLPFANERILSLAQGQRMIFAGSATNGVFRLPAFNSPPWQPAGLTGQKITALAAIGASAFAGTESNGLMVTTDDGNNWAKVGGGLPAEVRVLTLAVRDQTIFAGTLSGLWRSNDAGASWTKTSLPENLAVNAVLADGSNLIAGTAGSGVLLSIDDGATWNTFNDGLTNLDVLSLINFGGRLFAGTKNGVMVTEAGGKPNQPPTVDSQAVALDEDSSLAIKLTGADPDGDLISFGITANPKHGSLDGKAPNLTYTPFRNYFGADSFTFVASDGGAASAPATVKVNVRPVEDPLTISVSGDESAIVGGLAVIQILGIDEDGEKVIVTATQLPQDAILAKDNNQSRASVRWVPKSAGTYTLSFTATAESGASVSKDFKVTVTAATQPSDDWAQVPLFIDKRIRDILIDGPKIYLTLFGTPFDFGAGLLRSTDNGRTWARIGNGLPTNVNNYNLIKGGATLYLACAEGVFRSTDDGINWTNISNGKGLPTGVENLKVAAQGDRLVVWSLTQVFISLNAGGAWAEVTGNLPIKPSGSSARGGQISAATVIGDAALVSLSSGILATGSITFRSTNGGASWQSVDQQLASAYSISTFLVDRSRLYVIDGIHLHFSDDHGANWQLINPPVVKESGVPVHLYNGVASSMEDGLLLVLYGGIHLSRNNGGSWNAFKPIPANSIAIGESSLFAVVDGKLFTLSFPH